MPFKTNRRTRKTFRFRNPFRRDVLEQSEFDRRENDILLERIQKRIALLPIEEQQRIMSRVESRGGFYLEDFIHNPLFKYIFDQRAIEILEEMDRLLEKGEIEPEE
jgi:hypothetical protein